MGYRELIKQVQHDSGFSDAEAKEALDHTVELIAERLQEEEREDFASQLPSELQSIALAVPISKESHHKDIIEELMEKEDITADRAKKQLLSAWKALRSTISEGEIKDMKSQLPNQTAALLF